MRKLMAEGKLSGPPADLMSPNVAPEQLFDTEADHTRSKTLPTLRNLSTAEHCLPCARVGYLDCGDAGPGRISEPEEIVAPFDKEMHDWFVHRTGTKRNNYLAGLRHKGWHS